jgi:hypothetical protein
MLPISSNLQNLSSPPACGTLSSRGDESATQFRRFPTISAKTGRVRCLRAGNVQERVVTMRAWQLGAAPSSSGSSANVPSLDVCAVARAIGRHRMATAGTTCSTRITSFPCRPAGRTANQTSSRSARRAMRSRIASGRPSSRSRDERPASVSIAPSCLSIFGCCATNPSNGSRGEAIGSVGRGARPGWRKSAPGEHDGANGMLTFSLRTIR